MTPSAPLPLATPGDVLAFWFDGDQQRAAWFRKDDAFDTTIRTRFGATVDAAIRGDLDAWHDASDDAALARIVVLDQFTRNAFRGTARAFAGDPRALAASRDLIATRRDLKLRPVQRTFAYLPLEHSERLADQDESVRRFDALAAEVPAFADTALYAHKHRDIVVRFGRFPHRNAALGRASTPEEVAFLQQPGSSF